jgi:hypothetical protein
MVPSISDSAPVDNASLRAAVEAFATTPDQSSYLDVVRACLQGRLLLDSTGSDRPVVEADGSYSFPAGATLQFAGGTGPDGKPALFAFTSQEQINRMHPTDLADVQALVQPAAGALQLAATERYGWLYIDPAGPTCAISNRDAAFALRGERNDAVKEALEIAEAFQSKRAVMDALAQNGPLLLAVDTDSVPESGVTDGTPIRIRDSVDPDGHPVLLAFTSGPEVSARNVADSFATRTAAEIIRDAVQPPYGGLVLNPGGPWMALSPDELRAVLHRISGSPQPG